MKIIDWHVFLFTKRFNKPLGNKDVSRWRGQSMDSKQRNMAPMNIKVNPLGGAVCIVILLCMFLYMFGLPAWLSGHEERISMRQLLSAGIVLARRGGDRVRDIRRQNSLEEKVKGKTKEGANEMVSQGDLESHRAIVHGLSKVFPGLMVKKNTL